MDEARVDSISHIHERAAISHRPSQCRVPSELKALDACDELRPDEFLFSVLRSP